MKQTKTTSIGIVKLETIVFVLVKYIYLFLSKLKQYVGLNNNIGSRVYSRLND